MKIKNFFLMKRMGDWGLTINFNISFVLLISYGNSFEYILSTIKCKNEFIKIKN